MKDLVLKNKLGKKILEKLESEQVYLFHGSGVKDISMIEPRQSYTMKDDKKVKDGKPSVHATQIVDIAVLMALINSINCPNGFHAQFSNDDGKLTLFASQKSLDQLNRTSKGYVYVFNKKDFSKRNSVEYISYTKVKPILVVEVGKIDLSNKIEIII